jgi:hypothetical protein
MLLARLDDGDLHAERREQARVLAADDATAHDDHRFGNVVHAHDLVGVVDAACDRTGTAAADGGSSRSR